MPPRIATRSRNPRPTEPLCLSAPKSPRRPTPSRRGSPLDGRLRAVVGHSRRVHRGRRGATAALGATARLARLAGPERRLPALRRRRPPHPQSRNVLPRSRRDLRTGLAAEPDAAADPRGRMARDRARRRATRRAVGKAAVRRLRRGPADRRGRSAAAALTGSRDYVPAMRGVKPPGKRWLRLYAADIGRGPDGRWWALGDRAQAPSGSGYALENRLVVFQAFPSLYREMNVERLAPFFRELRAGLRASGERSEPRIGILTPGPLSATYFEQAYLARYLGFLLVEGEDSRDAGRPRVRAHDRRPQARRRALAPRRRRMVRSARAQLGLAYRSAGAAGRDPRRRRRGREHAGLWTRGSARAAAVPAETRAAPARRGPRDAQHRDLVVRAARGARARARRARDRVGGRRFDDAVPGFDGPQSVVGGELDARERARLRAAIETRGVDYVGQDIVRLSTMPRWEHGRLVPRPSCFASTPPRRPRDGASCPADSPVFPTRATRAPSP